MRSWILCAALVLSCKPNDGIDEEMFALCDDDVDGFVEAECARADPDGVYDCDDADPNAFPGATEACNGVDDDCDGTIDNGPVAVFFDGDDDGYGGDATTKCGVYDGYTDIGGDCDDDDADVHPGATEVCNGVDDDCIDGEQDATDAPTWYADTDQDGHGDVSTTVIGCAPGADWSAARRQRPVRHLRSRDLERPRRQRRHRRPRTPLLHRVPLVRGRLGEPRKRRAGRHDLAHQHGDQRPHGGHRRGRVRRPVRRLPLRRRDGDRRGRVVRSPRGWTVAQRDEATSLYPDSAVGLGDGPLRMSIATVNRRDTLTTGL